MLSDLPQGLWAVDYSSNSFKVVASWLSWACLIGDIWKRGRGVSVVRTQQGTAFKSWLINFTVKAGWNKSCGNVKQRLLSRTRPSCATELNIIKRTSKLQPLKTNSWQIIRLLSTAKQAWRNELSPTVGICGMSHRKLQLHWKDDSKLSLHLRNLQQVLWENVIFSAYTIPTLILT